MDIEKVKDGLKSIITMENWSCGTIDKNKEQAIGVYDNTRRIEKISQFDNLQDALIQYNTIDQKNSNISDFRANVVCDLWC